MRKQSTQCPAIRKFMAARKRELTTVKRSYPKGGETMSTAQYVAAFMKANNHNGLQLLPLDFVNMN
jgi:hypothetical protein